MGLARSMFRQQDCRIQDVGKQEDKASLVAEGCPSGIVYFAR
jgi:hypothetical protein